MSGLISEFVTLTPVSSHSIHSLIIASALPDANTYTYTAFPKMWKFGGNRIEQRSTEVTHLISAGCLPALVNHNIMSLQGEL